MRFLPIKHYSYCMITSSFLDKEVHVDDIDYGGVDNDGELDPSTKENYFEFKW